MKLLLHSEKQQKGNTDDLQKDCIKGQGKQGREDRRTSKTYISKQGKECEGMLNFQKSKKRGRWEDSICKTYVSVEGKEKERLIQLQTEAMKSIHDGLNANRAK